MDQNITTALGIELGSTRIKAVLTDSHGNVLSSGSYRWENSYKNGLWTYPLDEVLIGLQLAYRELAENHKKKYGCPLRSKMHRYLRHDARLSCLR